MLAGSELIFGLDSGGTKTVMALADRGGHVRRLRCGPSLDPFAVRDWPDRLASLVADWTPEWPSIVGGAFGLPCYGESVTVSALQRDVAARLLAVPHLVLNDVRVAFDGALAGRDGVLLLSGTGSMAWAGKGDRDMRVGGWGDAFGDEGSANWIGREALSLATRALDGRTPDCGFGLALIDGLGLSPKDLVDRFLASPSRRLEIAAVARTVDALAENGCVTAKTLLEAAGDHLADHVDAAVALLRLPERCSWSYAGGVFASRTVMGQVIRRIGYPPEAPCLPPVGGALLRAAQLSAWAVDATWIARLSRSLSAAFASTNVQTPLGP